MRLAALFLALAAGLGLAQASKVAKRAAQVSGAAKGTYGSSNKIGFNFRGSPAYGVNLGTSALANDRADCCRRLAGH